MHQKGQCAASRLVISNKMAAQTISNSVHRLLMWWNGIGDRTIDARHCARDEFPCHECGSATAPIDGPDEWYTVHDSVWKCAAASADSILCIGCLEARLGRRLRHTDFVAAVLNQPGYGHHSPRLQSRLRPD
ncbi:hypothetical protein ACFYO1_09960 [Nocardia sp. NPDC006044]|uniref:hypothetical protein n=1 Tax=Nocardia sp. NPDC006044 TaxID=3364306 RepID=UPI0036B44ADD